MNQLFPRPGFWDEAARQDQTRFTMLGEFLIFWLLFLVAMFGQSILWSAMMLPWMFGEQGAAAIAALPSDMSMEQAVTELIQRLPDWMRILDNLAYLTLGLTTIIYCRKVQKRSLRSMGLRGCFLTEYALGLLIGALIFGSVLGLGMITGAYRLELSDVSGERLWMVLCALPASVVQGASMELLVYGYFAPSLGKTRPVSLAILMSALAPAMLYSNLASLVGLNSLLLGMVLGVWVLKRGNLWGACGCYGIWLFACNFLCGFATAGQHEGIYLLPVQIDPHRVTLTGGNAGPLGGICTTVILVGLLMLILPLRAKDPAPPRPQQDEQAEKYL